MTKQTFSIFILLIFIMTSSGCALRECRNDLEVFGGFYCTSYVDNIGTRYIYVKGTYESPDIICAEASLVQWKRSSEGIDLGKRLILISRDEFTKDVIANKSQIEKFPDHSSLNLYKIPVAVNWQEEKIDFQTAKKWYLYPDNLDEKIPDFALDDFKKSMQLTPSKTETEGVIGVTFNKGDINCIVTPNFEDPYYKPVRSNLLKTILYPPAIAVDIVTLPIIIIGTPIYYIFHFANYGPGP